MRKKEVPSELSTVLSKYVEWLNSWLTESDNFRYSPDTFLKFDGENFFGRWEKVTQYETNFYEVHVFNVDDGDEGGPHTLTAYFTCTYEPSKMKITGKRLTHLFQEFDTEITQIMKDGELVKGEKQ